MKDETKIRLFFSAASVCTVGLWVFYGLERFSSRVLLLDYKVLDKYKQIGCFGLRPKFIIKINIPEIDKTLSTTVDSEIYDRVPIGGWGKVKARLGGHTNWLIDLDFR